MSETEKENQTNKIYLNYVGRMYSDKHFYAEVEKYGVQRAMPFSVLRSMSWGEPILLARWEDGRAKIFGYFRIEGVVVAGSEGTLEEFARSIGGIIVNGGAREIRVCGSYVIDSRIETDEDLPSLLKKYAEFLEGRNMNPFSLKWFARGSFRPFKETIVVPLKFSRGLLKVDASLLERELGSGEDVKRFLMTIHDYKRRRYLSKEAQAEYEGNLKGFL